MTETRLMSVAAVICLFVTFFLVAIGVLDAFYGAALGYFIGGLFFTWGAIRIQKVWQTLPPEVRFADTSFNGLRWFFIISALFATTAVIPHYILVLFNANLLVISVANWLSHVLLTTQIIVAGRLMASLYKASYVPLFTVVWVALGIISIIINVLYPDIYAPKYNTAFPLLTPSWQFSAIQQFLLTLAVTLPSLYVLFRAFTLPRSSVRTSALILSVGFLGGSATGAIVDYAAAFPIAGLFIGILTTVYPFMVAYAGVRIAKEHETHKIPGPQIT